MSKLKRGTISVQFYGQKPLELPCWLIDGTPFAVSKDRVFDGGRPVETGHGWRLVHIPSGLSVGMRTRPLLFRTRDKVVKFASLLHHPAWRKKFAPGKIPPGLKRDFDLACKSFEKLES